MQHASVVGDLVVGQQQEAHIHALHDGPQAGHSRANAHAHEAVFCSARNISGNHCKLTICMPRLVMAAPMPMPMDPKKIVVHATFRELQQAGGRHAGHIRANAHAHETVFCITCNVSGQQHAC